MKKLLMTLILAVTMQSGATSIDMTPVLATVTGYEHGIIQVALLADRRLQIVNNGGFVNTVKVSAVAMDRLENQVRQLAFTKVKETRRTMVCKMMIMPSLSDLSVSKYNTDTMEYSSELNLILTQESCALAYQARPENDRYYIGARELRAELVVLALNTLNLK